MADDVKQLDPASLRALAHPLRLRLLGLLRVEGPATATQLADRVGESSGSTSYHLRQLARHGFVRDDPSRGNGRERWWKAAQRTTSWRSVDFVDDPDTADAEAVLQAYLLQAQLRRLEHWFAQRDTYGREWLDAGTHSDYTVRLSAQRMGQLSRELEEVAQRYFDDPDEGPDTERTVVLLHVFPERRLP